MSIGSVASVSFLRSYLTLDVTQFNQALRQAVQETKIQTAHLSDAQKNSIVTSALNSQLGLMRKIHAQIGLNAIAMASITAPILAVTRAAEQAYAEFDKITRKIQTVTKESELGMAKISKMMIATSRGYAQSPTEMAKTAYVVAQAQFTRAQDINRISNAAARLSRASGGEVTPSTSVHTLTSMLHAFGLTSDAVDELTDKLIVLRDVTKLDLEQITRSVEKSESLFGNMFQGGNWREGIAVMTALQTSMTQKGTSGNVADTAIRGLISRIASESNSKKSPLNMLSQDFGHENALDFMKTDFMGLLDALRQKTKGDIGQLERLGFERREFTALSQVMRDSWEKFLIAYEASMKSEGRTAEALRDHRESWWQIRDALKSSYEEFKITWGRDAVEILTPLAKTVTEMLRAFVDMPPELRKTYIVFASIAALVPTLKFLGSLMSMIGMKNVTKNYLVQGIKDALVRADEYVGAKNLAKASAKASGKGAVDFSSVDDVIAGGSSVALSSSVAASVAKQRSWKWWLNPSLTPFRSSPVASSQGYMYPDYTSIPFSARVGIGISRMWAGTKSFLGGLAGQVAANSGMLSVGNLPGMNLPKVEMSAKLEQVDAKLASASQTVISSFTRASVGMVGVAKVLAGFSFQAAAVAVATKVAVEALNGFRLIAESGKDKKELGNGITEIELPSSRKKGWFERWWGGLNHTLSATGAMIGAAGAKALGYSPNMGYTDAMILAAEDAGNRTALADHIASMEMRRSVSPESDIKSYRINKMAEALAEMRGEEYSPSAHSVALRSGKLSNEEKMRLRQTLMNPEMMGEFKTIVTRTFAEGFKEFLQTTKGEMGRDQISKEFPFLGLSAPSPVTPANSPTYVGATSDSILEEARNAYERLQSLKAGLTDMQNTPIAKPVKPYADMLQYGTKEHYAAMLPDWTNSKNDATEARKQRNDMIDQQKQIIHQLEVGNGLSQKVLPYWSELIKAFDRGDTTGSTTTLATATIN